MFTKGFISKECLIFSVKDTRSLSNTPWLCMLLFSKTYSSDHHREITPTSHTVWNLIKTLISKRNTHKQTHETFRKQLNSFDFYGWPAYSEPENPTQKRAHSISESKNLKCPKAKKTYCSRKGNYHIVVFPLYKGLSHHLNFFLRK